MLFGNLINVHCRVLAVLRDLSGACRIDAVGRRACLYLGVDREPIARDRNNVCHRMCTADVAPLA